MDRWILNLTIQEDIPEAYVPASERAWGIGDGVNLSRTFPAVYWPDDGVAGRPTFASWTVSSRRLPW